MWRFPRSGSLSTGPAGTFVRARRSRSGKWVPWVRSNAMAVGASEARLAVSTPRKVGQGPGLQDGRPLDCRVGASRVEQRLLFAGGCAVDSLDTAHEEAEGHLQGRASGGDHGKRDLGHSRVGVPPLRPERRHGPPSLICV